MPTKQELQEFDALLRANRRLHDEVIQVLDLVKSSHPMDALRTGISALAAFDPEVKDNSTEATPQGDPIERHGPHDCCRPPSSAPGP